MSGARLSDKEIKELVHDKVHELAELPFVADKDFAKRALVRAFHAILRNERYELFMDDLMIYVENKDEQTRVY